METEERLTDRLNVIEEKVDRILSIIDRFLPLIERFSNGKIIPTFRKKGA